MTFSYISISTGYFLRNLGIARLGNIFKALGQPFILVTMMIYLLETCPESFTNLFILMVRSEALIVSGIFPLIFNFENSSFESIGVKFLGLIFLCVVGNIVLRWVMVETLGKSKIEIYGILRGNENEENKEDMPLLDE